MLDWWRTFYNALDRRFQLEIINPVQTKTNKFAANHTARGIVGQSRSTIDLWAWVHDGALVVVDLAKEQVGADIAALLGGTLANLVDLAIGRQAGLPPSRRRHVALLVDEFHALPAVDYAALLAQLAKYGASLTLATETLGALADVGGDQHLRTPSSATSTACSPSTAPPPTRRCSPRSWVPHWNWPTWWSWATASATPA